MKLKVKRVTLRRAARASRRVFLPAGDGVDHINIYSQGKTTLGQLLSNWSYREIYVPYEGIFKTVEGYIYWLLTRSPNRNVLKTTNGFHSKVTGRAMANILPSNIPEDELKAKVKAALLSKVSLHTDLQKELKESTLPFAHYYVYGDKPVKGPDNWMWIVDFWTELRSDFQKERKRNGKKDRL